MKATLLKVRSNHSNLADKYEGICDGLPKVGDSFILTSPTTTNPQYLDHNKAIYVRTTPITALVKLNDKVYEFETKNSKYSLELHG